MNSDWQYLFDPNKRIEWFSELKEGEHCWFPLTDSTLLVVEGTDAEKFLQGQCTCDLTQSRDNSLLLGAHCNPQGRMLSSFNLGCLGPDTFFLRVHNSIAEQALADFQKYIVFSKAKININQDFVLFGLYAKDTSIISNLLNVRVPDVAHTQLVENGWLIRVDQHQYEYWVNKDTLKKNGALFSAERCCAPHQWDLLNIRRGIAEVRAQTRSELLPQEINFQFVNGVSFKKGCYTGQEVIARLHFKGKLKKHMHRAGATSSILIEPGCQLFQNEKAVGSVILSAPASPNEYELLVLCQDSVAHMQDIQLKAPSKSFLRWLSLPYAIPG